MLKDLPTGLSQLLLLYWQTEEATDEERNLPEAEKVEAFLQWCRQPDNYKWGHPNNKETDKWLTEHGYSRIPNGNQTT